MGDILLTTPVLTALKKSLPGVTIDFLSHSMGKALLEGNPHVRSHFHYNDSFSWKDFLRLFKELRRQRYDYVFDFMNNPRSALFALMARAETSVSFESRRRLVYSLVVPKADDQLYIVDQKLKLLKVLDIEPAAERLLMPWRPQDLEPLHQLVRSSPEFAASRLRVILSPTHRRERRRWAGKHYAELADYLNRNWNASVTWLWGPGEEGFVDDIRAHCSVPTIKAPATSLKEMAALMANHDLFIGNSNGPSHFATAADICSLQLHGHTIAASWCPNNVRHKSIQSPKSRDEPETCMQFLTMAMVVEKLESMRAEVERVAQNRLDKKLISVWDAGR